MYLRSITLRGFKSFPDRTRLDFGPGVSVIVGPNGSGKSNVTDAVLWALGEQSPAAVRGQVMQDVIFAGASGRQGSRQAEVEIVLDDSEGCLGLGAPEVSIVRRLDRTGEGEYRLAGARCRLVDVIEILSETGLGKEMHSVISQGRVESIISSKPRDRRLLIEEAAGLGKHRKRRRRAQLKLERTQDNLDRALDVEREARTRLRPLKRQAEAAELHARLARQSLQARWELAGDDLRSHLEALAQAQAQAGAMRARREQVERELEQVARRREAAEESLASRSAQREELSRRAFAAQSAGDRVSYRLEAVRSTATSLEARQARVEQQLAALGDEPDRSAAEAQAGERVQKLQAELEVLEHARAQELEKALVDLQARHAQAQAEVDRRGAAVEAARQEREEAERLLDEARAQVHRAQRAVEQARFEAARVGSKLAAVNQFLRGIASTQGSAPRLADQLDVEPGYELAVAAALDGRLDAAVVADLAAAQDVLDQTGGEGGRALIVGLSDAAADSSGDLGAAPDPPAPDARWLAGCVRGSGEAAALARGLLAQTWVLSGFDALPPGFAAVAVTREGRVLSTGAAELRQAPALGAERVLAQRNRRQELIGESETAAGAEVAANAELDQAEAAQERAQDALEQLLIAHRSAVRDRDEAAEEERRIAATIDRRAAAPDEGPGEERRRALTAELRAEQDALTQIARERTSREQQVQRLRSTVTSVQDLLPHVQALAATLEEVSGAIMAGRQSFEEALAADRQAGEQVTAELRACAQEEAPLQAQLHRVGEELTESEVALQRARDRTEEVERELHQLAEELELQASPAEAPLSDEERESLEARVERLARRREQIGPVNPLAEEEYADAVAHVEELERQRTDLETALRELQKLISDTDREIRETFERTFSAAAENFEQVVGQLFPGGRGRLRLVTERERQARVLGGETPVADGGDGDPVEEDELQSEEDRLGVEIEINPPGKEMTRLSLLSGGEKSLTALAFLFAVFLARPCPFYILDEVEAALDDLNMDRFLTMLRSYAEQAQFIVVTHQRRTMEAADYLYGVSMGADGVSKVISRRLDSGPAALDAA